MMLFGKLFFVLIIFTWFSSLECKTDYAKRIRDRYYDTATECRNSDNIKKPAYQCSGILIRGVRDGNKPAWGLKASNKKRESFSVAFLRNDTPFDSFPFGHNAGFIIYPHLKTPRHKNSYRVYCAFPFNGSTDRRAGKHGCGKSQSDKTGSSTHCDAQGITTYQKWKRHLNDVISNFGELQCAFDMTLSTAARDFAITLKANAHLRKMGSMANNELLFHMWTAERPQKLPIEAFWCFRGSKKSCAKAKSYQKHYFRKTGEKRPIVGIRLPTKSNPNISIREYV